MDQVALDEWHVVAALDSLPVGQEIATRLLDTDLTLMRSAGDIVAAWPAASGKALPVCIRYGHVWSSLGTPARPLFDLPELAEPGRRSVLAGPLPVHVSAPRAIENFLDPGRSPEAAAPSEIAAHGAGLEIRSDAAWLRVPHPYCAIRRDANQDVTALFVQPVEEERIVVHLLASPARPLDAEAVRAARQRSLAEDKPILENQIPKRLPLHPAGEIAGPADGGSLAYRRWLAARGIRYGTIPA